MLSPVKDRNKCVCVCVPGATGVPNCDDRLAAVPAIAMARALGVPVVRAEYIEACVAAGKLLDVKVITWKPP